MKVMSYNTMHGVDHMHRMKTKETVVNLDGIVSVIAKYAPDIVGLNEMYDAPVENLENQVGYLANKLGYEYYYFAGAIDIKGGKYGNGLLSRYPIKKVEKIMIPDPIIKNEDAFYETRCIIKSVIEVDGIEYNVLVSHFGLAKKEQENATETLLNEIEGLNNVIFMGDLNMTRENSNIKAIEDNLNNTLCDESLSFPSDNPQVKIDYIFTSKDIKYGSPKILNDVFSDHLPHYVEILRK